MPHTMDPFRAKLAAAATGSTLTALTMTPFDVVKTRLQTQPPKPPQQLFPQPPPNTCCQATNPGGCVRRMSSLARPALTQVVEGEIVCIWDHGVFRTERVNGFYDAIRHVWRAEGVSGLWKGTGTTLLIGVPASTSYMLTYDHLSHNVLPSVLPSSIVPLASGIFARTMITSIVSPLELVRTNLQSTPLSADAPHTLRSVLTSIRTITQAQGVGYLWRGLGPTLWRDVPFSGLYWAGYEAIKGAFERNGREGAPVAFVSGAVSGTTAALLTSPFDVLKTRRQAIVMSTPERAASSISLAVDILRSEGIAALYAGILPRIVKIAPACGIMIACYEGVGRFLMKKEDDDRIS